MRPKKKMNCTKQFTAEKAKLNFDAPKSERVNDLTYLWKIEKSVAPIKLAAPFQDACTPQIHLSQATFKSSLPIVGEFSSKIN